MFIDASALCAVLLGEADRMIFHQVITTTRSDKSTSAIAVWETMRAVVRETDRGVAETQKVIEAYLRDADVRLVVIGAREQRLAVDAYARFGKGRHPAGLNMGDCFAYACALSNRIPLLFKGEDFGQTDLETVRLD